MKKLHLLASASLTAILLGGCANNPPVPENGKPPEPTPADSSTIANPSSKDNEVAQATSNSMKSMQAPGPDTVAQPTASITLSQKGDQIIAKVVTNWETAKQGELYLKWVAPNGTSCHNTQLPITKYKDSNDISTAKRPVNSLYSDKECNGIWNAQVITKNGSVIANQSITIAPNATTQTTN